MHPAVFVLAVGVLSAWSAPVAAQTATPPSSATDVTRADFLTVLKSMNPDGVADQQVKVVDIGAYNVAVGILHRSGKAKQTAIAHSDITEIYYVITGAGTFVTGGTMTGAAAVDPTGNVVKILVGPSTGPAIAGGQSRRIGPGDVIIVPPGVAHWFSAIESDLDYLVFRVDPGHVLPAGYVHPLLKK